MCTAKRGGCSEATTAETRGTTLAGLLPDPCGECSRLVPQTGGAARLGLLPELLLAHAEAVTERVDVEEHVVVLDAAGLAAAGVRDGREDVVAGVDVVAADRLHLVPGVAPALPHSADRLAPDGGELLAGLVDHVQVQVVERGVELAALVALEQPAHGLDVLQRHGT